MAFLSGSLAPKLLPSNLLPGLPFGAGTSHRVFGPVYESDSGYPGIGSPISDGGPGGGGGSVDSFDFGDVPVIRVN
jgi:hypothetical protein